MGLLPAVVTADHTQSFYQGTKWWIFNVVFNWQAGLLLWFSLVLLSQHKFSGWIGFFYLLAVELLWFQVARRSRMTEKAIRVSLKKLPNKNFRKIIVHETICRLKSLFHWVLDTFWEWPEQQVPPEASFAGCSDSGEPVPCRGTSLCIPHLLQITFCHESVFLFVLLIISDPLLFNSSSEVSILQRNWLWRWQARSKSLQNMFFPQISD